MDLSNIKQLRAAAAEVVDICDTARDLDRILAAAVTDLRSEIDVLVSTRVAEEQTEKSKDRAQVVMTPLGPAIVVSHGSDLPDLPAALTDFLSTIIPGLRPDPGATSPTPENGGGQPEPAQTPEPDSDEQRVERVEPSPTFLSDGNGIDLFMGDRVLVRDSRRFGEVQGNVTGTENDRLVIDLDISTSTIMRDASHEGLDENLGRGYTSSPDRVTRLAGQTAAFAEG